jgi:hypothetical protein
MSTFDPTAPKYRYFVADLLSNAIIAEIPFRGVSYERAIKAAGSFSGSIAVLDRTAALNLYDTTLPGRTALYVVRENVCVWGGIIWSRSYSAKSKSMTVSASEFQSYFYHRNIWKTYSHDYGATIVSTGFGTSLVTLDFGSFDFVAGSTVNIQFYEISNFRYDGYYTILSPSLTTTTFTIGTPSGKPVLPAGTYTSVTVRVRVDTYDYVRQLLDEVAMDFSGIKFPNGEIQPGVSTSYEVTQKQLTSNIATLTLNNPHDIIIGQSIDVENVDSTFDGVHRVIQTTSNTVSYDKTAANVSPTAVSGLTRNVVLKKLENNSVITLTTSVAHGFQPGDVILVQNVDDPSATFFSFDGTHTISEVPTPTTLKYVIYSYDLNVEQVAASGTVARQPRVFSNTYGPYPANSDIGIDYSTGDYSLVNTPNKTYRGYELRSVGEELDEYSDIIDGFEYRVDCEYDSNTQSFSKTFVLLPINFPNPPNPGEVAPLSRYGADRFVFEYPGNIEEVVINESAENAATRFFVVGNIGDLGDEASQPYSVAAATDLLEAGWPILDMEETRQDESDEELLYSHAQRYLSEFRPPVSDVKVTINGSLSPIVGSYKPGDWCALIINDEFVRMRLASDLEVRDDVIVRKIENIKVTVPDGTAFPEQVELQLIPEWEVDKRG